MTDENKASFEREIKLEQQLADMTKDRNWHKQAYQGLVNGLADTASLQATIAQLQATLAAREARIEELLDGRYKAALYDLIIDLSRMELSEMSALGRAAWDRLVKGGWYADDLEKLLMQASAAQQARGSSGGEADDGAGA